MPLELFPSVPEDLSAVEIDVLRGLLGQYESTAKTLVADMQLPKEERTIDIGEMSADELMSEHLRPAVEAKRAIEEALATREEAEQTFLTELAAVAEDLGVQPEAAVEPEGAAEPSEDEPAPDDPSEPEADDEADEPDVTVSSETEVEVTAAAEPARPMSIPRGASRHEPRPTPVAAGGGAQIAATSNLQTIKVNEGAPLGRAEFVDAALRLAKKIKTQKVKGGSRDFFSVGLATFDFPDEMTLGKNEDDNLEKIRRFAAPLLGAPSEMPVWEFMADGGICAPPTPFYDVPGFASRERPVRGALPSFNAVRGGVSIPSVNIVDRADSGVTIIEASEDAQGGSFATKACRAVDCATWADTFVGIISHCLEVGNLNARTWPEGVALEEDNLMAGHAASAESRLLGNIRSDSIRVTATSPYNAVHGLIYAIVRAQASIQNNLRAATGASYTALIPEFMSYLLVADLAAQSAVADRYVAMSQVSQYLARLNVNAVWYKDTPMDAAGVLGTSQLMPVEVDGTSLDVFPLEAQIGVYLNGVFIHLDGGTLELGIVRDSDLNHQNLYELFGETFENVARVGPAQATRWITLDTCPNGTFPALATAITC